MKTVIAFALALFASAALATNVPAPKGSKGSKPAVSQPVKQTVKQTVKQSVRQSQGQAQHQSQGQSQTATGGAGGSASSDASSSANNALNVSEVRQAPSVSAGSVFIPECGAGGSAGGSDRSGSAVFGWAYVPAWCQDFKYAAWLWSVGDHEGACKVMAESKPGKRAAKKGISAPSCVPPKPPQPVAAPAPCPAAVSCEQARRIDEQKAQVGEGAK